MRTLQLFGLAVLTWVSVSAIAQQGPVLFFGIMELSGTGATPGNNFDNGVKLAVKEINAAGGILGRKINYVSTDTQTNPTVAKAVAQKAIDEGAFVVLGPVHSGSMIVSMGETRRAEVTNFTGGEAASSLSKETRMSFELPSRSRLLCRSWHVTSRMR
jgi:branched-chain amino acid transport system substrate-binding protein